MESDENKDKAFYIESLDINDIGNETTVEKSQEIARNVREGKNDEIEFQEPKPLEKNNEILNRLLSKIGIKNLIVHQKAFYIQNGIEFEKFEKILIKADLEQVTYIIAAVCWHIKTAKDRSLPREKAHKRLRQEHYEYYQKKISEAETLKMLLLNNNLKLQISDIYQVREITDEDLLNILINTYDIRIFGDNAPQTTELKINALDNIISKGNPIKVKKGAPSKNQFIGTLAEVVLCIIKFEQYSESINTYNMLDIKGKMQAIEPRKTIKFSNSDCNIIHDILVAWELIDDKRNNTINTVTPVDYIKGLINNIRKQRPDFYAPGSGKGYSTDSYLF